MNHLRNNIYLVGILNVTPDSFSDGGEFEDNKKANDMALVLFESGADFVDIGGDSTRPGSLCVGADTEWLRIASIVETLSSRYLVSVDTHFASTAEKSLKLGAKIINDVSAGHDSKMFEVIASHNAKYVMMFSRCSIPHVFDEQSTGEILEQILVFFSKRIELALAAGIKENQIILDPGMGAFISNSPQISWSVIDRFKELEQLGFPLMIGVSRKGFLRAVNEHSPKDRDNRSAQIAKDILSRKSPSIPYYIRAHNVKLHKEILNTPN